jgi:hypothetical protein
VRTRKGGTMDATATLRTVGALGLTITISAIATACTVGDSGSGIGGGGGPGLGTGDAGESKGGGSGDESDDGDGLDDGIDDGGDDDPGTPSFDLGTPPSADDGTPTTGCTKADFLFVIDNSRSMQGKQEALAQTFKPFMQQITDNLETDDVHVMVVDTDGPTLCTPEDCADPGTNGPVLEHCLEGAQTDNGYACTAVFDACDSTRGAGVVHPAGNWASNKVCPVEGDKRYLDQTDDLEASFDCMARVGTAGKKRERPMDAMLAALDPGNACNAGFLREDAILVITFISDDQCWEDEGDPQAWKAALEAIKPASATVVVGFIPNTDTCKHDNDACDSPQDVIDGQHWRQFVESFEDGHGLHGLVCDTEQFADLFGAAVAVIDTTCDEFEPPG